MILIVIFWMYLWSPLNHPSVLGINENPETWLQATKTCQKDGKILDPMDSNVFPKLHHDLSMWTPNYMFNLGCNKSKGSQEELKLLHVNRIKEDKLIKNGICLSDSNTYIVCSTDVSSSLVNVTSMMVLSQVMQIMTMNTSYVVNYVDDTIVLGENEGKCEVLIKFANKTEKCRKEVSCVGNHRFQCSEAKYFTVIKKVIRDSCYKPDIGESPLYQGPLLQSGYILNGLSVLVTVMILIGLVIIGCLIKRWMSKMQLNILETLRQKFDHRMYGIERIEANQVPEPATPISPGGSSVYENYLRESSQFIPNLNDTFSYYTSYEVRRPVTVPMVMPDTYQNAEHRPRITIPSRIPSRENAVRHKTNSRQFPPFKRTRPPARLPLDISRSSNQSEIELQCVAEETRFIENEECSKCKSKPQPTPELELKKARGMTVRDISGEFLFYLDKKRETRTDDRKTETRTNDRKSKTTTDERKNETRTDDRKNETSTNDRKSETRTDDRKTETRINDRKTETRTDESCSEDEYENIWGRTDNLNNPGS